MRSALIFAATLLSIGCGGHGAPSASPSGPPVSSGTSSPDAPPAQPPPDPAEGNGDPCDSFTQVICGECTDSGALCTEVDCTGAAVGTFTVACDCPTTVTCGDCIEGAAPCEEVDCAGQVSDFVEAC